MNILLQIRQNSIILLIIQILTLQRIYTINEVIIYRMCILLRILNFLLQIQYLLIQRHQLLMYTNITNGFYITQITIF